MKLGHKLILAPVITAAVVLATSQVSAGLRRHARLTASREMSRA